MRQAEAYSVSSSFSFVRYSCADFDFEGIEIMGLWFIHSKW